MTISIPGFATKEATSKFSQKFSEITRQNFKKIHDLTLSNVGIGTYLGDPDTKTDDLVTSAIKKSITSGINVIDTAINYRSQKAERAVGKAIAELVKEEKISRDEIFVSSKNGYVTNDADIQLDLWPYVNQEYTQKGIIKEGDISSGYHCMTVKYLEDQLDRSLKNLGLDCVDLMYLHNGVEGQIKDIKNKDEFIAKLEQVFQLYEQKRQEGKIRNYGMATWESFRVDKNNPQYLSLDQVLSIATKVGGTNHGFRFIQLPFNMYYDQALLFKNHVLDGSPASVLDVALKNNIGVFSSVPLMQGRLLQPGSMPEFGDLPANLRALQFIRCTPGVVAPLVGQKSPEHVFDNLKIMEIPTMSNLDFSVLVKKLTSK